MCLSLIHICVTILTGLCMGVEYDYIHTCMHFRGERSSRGDEARNLPWTGVEIEVDE